MSKDDFWTVDKLLPKLNSGSSELSRRGVPLSSLGDSQIDPASRFGEKYLLANSRVVCHYSLSFHGGSFSFPDIETYYDDAPFEPCDLFSPEYLALSNAQKRYFGRFIRQTEMGTKTETSFAYIKLAICYALDKAINDELPPLFFTLWDLYRSDFPAAEKLFCDVFCDWIFYHTAQFDFDRVSKLLCRGTSLVQPFLYQLFLFDHLFSEGKHLSVEESEFILRNTTSLSFRKSRAYRSNTLFANLCEQAVREAMDKGVFNRKETNACLFDLQIPMELRSIRKLFPDLPRPYVAQAEICLVYIPLLGNEVIRDRIDAVVRYLEQRIRSILRLKNHVGRVAVTPEHKAFLDEILRSYEQYSPPVPVKEKILRETPDPPRKLEFDPEEAKAIEEDSWTITQKLTEIYENKGEMITLGNGEDEAFDNLYRTELEALDKTEGNDRSERLENPFLEFAAALSPEEDAFLAVALYQGSERARGFARARGAFFDALIASCNGKAAEITGDAILDPIGNVYEEYEQDLKEVFLPPEGENGNA